MIKALTALLPPDCVSDVCPGRQAGELRADGYEIPDRVPDIAEVGSDGVFHWKELSLDSPPALRPLKRRRERPKRKRAKLLSPQYAVSI